MPGPIQRAAFSKITAGYETPEDRAFRLSQQPWADINRIETPEEKRKRLQREQWALLTGGAPYYETGMDVGAGNAPLFQPLPPEQRPWQAIEPEARPAPPIIPSVEEWTTNQQPPETMEDRLAALTYKPGKTVIPQKKPLFEVGKRGETLLAGKEPGQYVTDFLDEPTNEANMLRAKYGLPPIPTTTQRIGEAIAPVISGAEVASGVVEKYVAKPFAATVAAPFMGVNPLTQPEQVMPAYEEWESPLLVKGFLELIPWLFMPAPGAKLGVAPLLAKATTNISRAASKATFKMALNTGLDKWIATQGRQVGMGQVPKNFIQKYLVSHPEVTEIVTNNLVRRMAEKKGTQYAAQQAARDTIEEIGPRLLTQFTEGGTAVPGQTRPLAELVTAGRAELPKPVIPEVPPEMAPLTSVQPSLPGMQRPVQVKAFEEFGVGPGAGGVSPGLFDIENLKAAQKAKPLPGQMALQGRQIESVQVDQIKVAPKRFQFRQLVDPVTGVTTKLAEVQKYEPILGGTVYGWQDKQGTIWIANGHHRLELAKRSGEKTINMMIDREVDGVTEKMARVQAAVINIAEDQGTPFDVAKFLRDSGKTLDDLKQYGVAPKGRLASRGAAIAGLDDSLFQKVATGQLDEDSAAIIGAGLPGKENFASQREVAKLVSEGRREVTPKELVALIEEAKAAGITKTTTLTLFGETEVEKSNLLARARVRAFIEEELAKDRRLFGYVTGKGRPEALLRGKTTVDVAAGQELAKQSGTALAIFKANVNAVGPINDIVGEAATGIMQGGDINAIKTEALNRIRETITNGEPAGAARRRDVVAGEKVPEVKPAKAAEVATELKPPVTTKVIGLPRVEDIRVAYAGKAPPAISLRAYPELKAELVNGKLPSLELKPPAAVAKVAKPVAPVAPKVTPEVITEEQYLATKGAPFMGGAEPAIHKNIPEGKVRQQGVNKVQADMAANNAKRQAFREEYQAKVASGEIRPPTRTESLMATAQGNPDNEATQAARRLLEKQGINWQEPAIPEAPVVPKEVKDEAKITFSMPESYVQARKRPDGKWQLFFTGTRNEVFPNELFNSVTEAKMAFRVAKAKLATKPVTPSQLPFGEAPKVPSEVVGWAEGARAKIISRYGDVPVGKEGTVVKAWVVKTGDLKGQTNVTLDFGVNLTGQRLRQSFPANSLKLVTEPFPTKAIPEPAIQPTYRETPPISGRVVPPEQPGVPPSGTGVPPGAPPVPPSGGVPPVRPTQPPTGAPLTPQNAIDELLKALRKGKTLQAPTRAMQHADRSQRVATAIGHLQNPNLSTSEAFIRAKGAYAGKLGRAELKPLELSEASQQMLRDTVRNTRAIPDNYAFTRTTADDALQKIFSGELPTKGEISLLEELFGSQLGGVLRGLRPLKDKIIDNALDILNLPRTVMAAYDVSYPFRQALWASTANWKRLGAPMRDMFKAFGSETFGQSLDDFYRGNIAKNIAPDASWLKSQEHNLFYAPYQKGQGFLPEREELFMSRLAEKIPGIRMSERAYVTYGNKLRQDLWKYYSKRLEKAGAEGWEYDELAKALNILTGRGELGPLSQSSPIWSTILFSPRMQASTVEMPFLLASKSPAVRRIAAENIGETLAAGVGILTLAGLAGASVEWDPRSSDFAKIRIGNSRIDIWGGKQQYTVLLARLIAGQGKSETGEIYTIGPDSFAGDKINLLTHFARGKLAPGPGLVTDIYVGKDFLGRPMTMNRSGEIAVNAIAPMSIKGTVEGIKQDKAGGGAISGLSYLGFGVSSYGGTVAKVLKQWLPDFAEYNAIPANELERQAKGGMSRERYRLTHPEVDAKLFITGQTRSLNPGAIAIARKLIQENEVDSTQILGIQTYQKDQQKRQSLGLRPVAGAPVDILMKQLEEPPPLVKGYLSVSDNIWSKYNPILKNLSDGVDELMKTDKKKAEEILRKNPEILRIQKEIGDAKERFLDMVPQAREPVKKYFKGLK